MPKKPRKLSAKECTENYSNAIAKNRNVIACRLCGSTDVDQRSRFSVRCAACNSTGYFDGASFAIIRQGEIIEALTNIFRDEVVEPDPSNWKQSMRGALGELLSVIESVMPVDGQAVLAAKDFKKFTECWDRCRPIIERESKRVKKDV